MKLKTTVLGLLSLFLFFPAFAENEHLLFSPKGIAEIYITLADGKKIGDIKNEKVHEDYAGKVKGEIVIKNSSTSTYESTELYKGYVLVDGRGNTSWHRPKRPYNIDLVKSDWETEAPAALLGMPSCDEWSLLAFWNDRSLMRLPLAAYLGQYLDGIPWSPRVQYAVLYINGDYRGLYCLSEKIMRDDNRVNIKKLNATSTDLSGGYILEASPKDGHKSKPIEVETQIQTDRSGINFVFKYPKAKNVTDPQRYWIKAHLDEFENVLWGSNFKDATNGYRKYINEDSFIDWTILHEMSKGCDNLFHASIFVQKDRNGKLDMSAPWDFDLSFGNSGIYTEVGNWIRTHRWFARLYEDERYAQKYNARYKELMPLFEQIPAILQANYKQLEEAWILEMEYLTFPEILLEYEDTEKRKTPTTYKGHVQFFSEWVMSRNNWIYIHLGLNDEEKGKRMTEIKPVIRVMNPEDLAGVNFQVKVMKSDDNNNKYTYKWSDSRNFLAMHHSRNITAPGKYWVEIKDEWGNVSQASDTLYYQVEPWDPSTQNTILSGSEFFTLSNPVQGLLNINFQSSNSQCMEIGLYDTKGVLRKSKTIQLVPSTNQIQMNIADVKNGIYILRLRTENQNYSAKIVLK